MFDDIEFTAEAMRELQYKFDEDKDTHPRAMSMERLIESKIKWDAYTGQYECCFSEPDEIDYLKKHSDEYKARGFHVLFRGVNRCSDPAWASIKW